MNRSPRLAHALGRRLLLTAAAIDAGQWCFQCHGVADDVCKEGKCLDVVYETDVDHTAFQHEPNVDFGGGE